MKHLLFTLAMVLSTSSFSQYINVFALIYDSLEVCNGGETFTSTVMFQTNPPYSYSTEVFFRWSPDREELESGAGTPGQYRPISPGTTSVTETYSIAPTDYQHMAPLGSGLYFKIYYEVVDENGDVVQVYDGSVHTWRFPMISTGVEEESVTETPLYPNPTNTDFMLPSKVTDSSVQLVSVDGRTSVLPTVGGRVSVETLSPGSYVVLSGHKQNNLGRIIVY